MMPRAVAFAIRHFDERSNSPQAEGHRVVTLHKRDIRFEVSGPPLYWITSGRCHAQGGQMAKSVHGHVHFGAVLALGAVIAGAGAALGCRAQGATVYDCCRGLLRSAGGQAQQRPQVLRRRLKTSR